MNIVADVLIGLVAALHLYFLVLEMFLWTTPTGRRVFGLEADFAEESKALAANQGLYNGFLAAGLVWGLVADNTDAKVFFLVCVVRRGRLRRRDRQQADPGRPGGAGSPGAGCAGAQLSPNHGRQAATPSISTR